VRSRRESLLSTTRTAQHSRNTTANLELLEPEPGTGKPTVSDCTETRIVPVPPPEARGGSLKHLPSRLSKCAKAVSRVRLFDMYASD
jgi:hypothetical protein